MPHLAQQLLAALVNVEQGQLKPGSPSGKVKLDWVLGEAELRGEFTIPLTKRVDPVTAALIVEAADFVTAPEYPEVENG